MKTLSEYWPFVKKNPTCSFLSQSASNAGLYVLFDFSLCCWINSWVAGDLRRHDGHVYDGKGLWLCSPSRLTHSSVGCTHLHPHVVGEKLDRCWSLWKQSARHTLKLRFTGALYTSKHTGAIEFTSNLPCPTVLQITHKIIRYPSIFLWGDAPVNGKKCRASVFPLLLVWVSCWTKQWRRRWFETPWRSCDVIVAKQILRSSCQFAVTRLKWRCARSSNELHLLH